MTNKNYGTFEKQSIINTTPERLFDFHNDPRALAKLTPLPIIMQLHRDDRTSLTEGEIEFTLWFGPVPFRWTARHEPGPTDTSFADRMVEGPLAHWRHEHIFEAAEVGSVLVDRIVIGHQPGLQGVLTRLLFGRLPLHILFFYRHLRTRFALRNS